MNGEIETNKKSTIKKVISVILAPIIVILIPFTILIILHSLFPTADAYLLTGFSFYIFISTFIWIIPISIIISIISKIKENKEKNSIKDYLKKEYITIVFMTIAFIIFVILGSLSLSECYNYYKDIKNYPQEAIMSDVTIERLSGRTTKGYFITGYIDGKKTRLQLTRDAQPKGYYIKSAKKVKIYYHKNIKEVYKIRYWY